MSRLKLVRLEHVLAWPNDVANHVMRPPLSSGAASAAAAVTYKSRDPCMDTALADKVSVWRGDITQLAVGAIVNAANETLLGGGGVDGAIHRAAGPQLREECARLGGCAVGDAKVTGGHCLPASHVIHTVGPRGEQPHLLESCYRRCLEEASDLQLRSLAFPCIATGVYGYPNAAAARVALSTVRHYLEKYGADFDRIIFCLFLNVDVQVYQQLMHEFFPLPQK